MVSGAACERQSDKKRSQVRHPARAIFKKQTVLDVALSGIRRLDISFTRMSSTLAASYLTNEMLALNIKHFLIFILFCFPENAPLVPCAILSS